MSQSQSAQPQPQPNSSQPDLQSRIQSLVEHISAGMFEREEVIAVALLSALCGQNCFLFGPPGTAKSLISRRIASAFAEPSYFEYLMNRFSTPEEVFGPVSIKALKQDQYLRKTEHYLPKAEFAFLDEIWKSSPAILNTLLTLMNERVFRNGERLEQAPLKALIAASNETPQPDQGLEALYDRFIVRLLVSPILHNHHFDQLLNSAPSADKIEMPDGLAVTSEEWQQWQNEIDQVAISNDCFTIIHLIRSQLEQQREELDVYVSDRRWQRAARLMKASAFFHGRNSTNHSDALLLRHCLWTQEGNRDAVGLIVLEAVQSVGFEAGMQLSTLDQAKDRLDREINDELFYSQDVYKTERIEDREFFFLDAQFELVNYRDVKEVELYIPVEKLRTRDVFSPLDDRGNEISEVTAQFEGQGSCRMEYRDYSYRYEELIFQPEVLFYRGDRKPDVNRRLVNSLAQSVRELKAELSELVARAEASQAEYRQQLRSLFVPGELTDQALVGVEQQMNSLRLRIKDCERLEALCR